MTIEVQCRECGGVLRARDDSIGKTLPCPKCGNSLVVEGVPVPAQGRSGGNAALIVALLALAVSIFAAAWAYFHDPLGKGLGAYDFSTPEGAVRSELEVQLNQDWRARLEMDAIRNAKRHQEFLDSLEIHKTLDYDRTGEARIANDSDYEPVWKVVLLTYRQEGRKQHSYRFFRKHKESGMWLQAYASLFSIRGELRKEIDDWNRQFVLGNRRPPFQPPGANKTLPAKK
jgi:hypothetical protein